MTEVTSNRAIEAAELAVSRRPGLLERYGKRQKSVNGHSFHSDRAADRDALIASAIEMDVSWSGIKRAVRVLKKGDAEIIERIKRRELGIHEVLYGRKAYVPRMRSRKSKPDYGLSEKLIRRNEAARLQARIWKELRTAIDALTNLPMAEEVAQLRFTGMQVAYVDERLSKAVKWIGDFTDGWQRR